MRHRALSLVLAVLLAGCATDEPQAGGDTDAPPDRCARVEPAVDEGRGGGDRFWDLMTAACRVSSDGDRRQGRALGALLADRADEEVVAFHEGMVREHRQLLRSGLGPVADDLCFPGLGLGDDLSADYRSWLIGQGEAVTAWVRGDPERLGSLPGAEAGCGLGEFLGYAATDAHRENTRATGRGPALRPLESLRP